MSTLCTFRMHFTTAAVPIMSQTMIYNYLFYNASAVSHLCPFCVSFFPLFSLLFRRPALCFKKSNHFWHYGATLLKHFWHGIFVHFLPYRKVYFLRHLMRRLTYIAPQFFPLLFFYEPFSPPNFGGCGSSLHSSPQY